MSTISLTAREQQLLCAVVEVMKASIDWKKVAEIASFNTDKQARDKWPAVKAKLTGGKAKRESANEGDEKKDAAAAGGVKKRKAGSGRGGVGGGDGRNRAKKARVEGEYGDDDELGEKAGRGDEDDSDGELI